MWAELHLTPGIRRRAASPKTSQGGAGDSRRSPTTTHRSSARGVRKGAAVDARHIVIRAGRPQSNGYVERAADDAGVLEITDCALLDPQVKELRLDLDAFCALQRRDRSHQRRIQPKVAYRSIHREGEEVGVLGI